MNTEVTDHDIAVQRINELLVRRRIASARELLRDVLPQFPDSPVLLEQAAWTDYMDSDHDAARATIGTLLDIAPDSYEGRFLLSRIDAEDNRHADAERTVIDLLHDYPEDPALYAHYASIMLETFHTEKAERLAAEALRRDPDNEEALNVQVLVSFANSDDAERQRRLQTLLTEYPDSMTSAVRMVQLLLDKGKHAEAYELSRELVQHDPGNRALVEMASELRMSSHWSMLPLWPMRKWGWGGSIGIWFAAMLLLQSGVFEGEGREHLLTGFIVLLLSYVVYSWVWPPILRRLMRVQ